MDRLSKRETGVEKRKGKGKESEREKIITLQKGKRGIMQIVFGRTGIVVLFLLLQALILLVGFGLLRPYIVVLFGGYAVFGLIIAIIIINREENPAFQIAWLIPVLLIPFFGGLFYLFVQSQLGHRILHRRMSVLIDETRKYAQQKNSVTLELVEKNPAEWRLAQYAFSQGDFPVYDNTGVKYFPLGEDKFEEMLIQLEKAEKFIFLEYFIVEEGYMWGRVLEVLQRKASQGVEVRMMYDGMCSLMLLPYGYPSQLESLGIRCKMFSPIRPALSTMQNHRDHRKILVIDGKVAFTGGVNLADEYINRKVRFGHWKDTAIMVEGEAVRSFTMMFLQMWNITEKEEDYGKYLDVDVRAKMPTSCGYVMPYGDSPVDNENLAENIYLDIINRAVKYVHIMTPYLILDQELIRALTFAAKRGVDVTIIMPHIPDKKYAFALAKTYYPGLIRAGVNIFEYTPGFMHAKVFTSDDERAVVGTVNLDYRSLYLHFECGVYLYQVPEIAEIEKDVQETLTKCQRVTLVDCKREKLWIKIYGRVLRLFAPLM
ncbi:MAG TPA: cardiolipin synthase [Candidatus Pelethocola excrementipullorum]|nr:cardiolipin synthase [Candidatus Pelethocola excrementipullorum]